MNSMNNYIHYKVKWVLIIFKGNKLVGNTYLLSLDVFNLLNELLHKCKIGVIYLTKTTKLHKVT